MRGTSTSDAGPARTTLGADTTRAFGLRALARRAVEHVRDLRSELMLKLLFHDRAGLDPTPLLDAQARVARTAPSARSTRRLASASGFDRTLALWRLSSAAPRSRSSRRCSTAAREPVVYRPIGYVASPHAALDGMPLQPIADTSGASTIEVSADTAAASPTSTASRMSGWSRTCTRRSAGSATVPAFLDDRPHGTFATRSPHRPNPIGLSLARIVAVGPSAVVVDGLDLLDGTPVLDLKPFVPLFDTPAGDVRSGWFESRAERVFTRTSDDRFALRSRRGGASAD